MLRDRKELLEQEIIKATAAAASRYLTIVTQGSDPHDAEYQQLKDRITSLNFDLNMVNQLINQGMK